MAHKHLLFSGEARTKVLRGATQLPEPKEVPALARAWTDPRPDRAADDEGWPGTRHARCNRVAA